MPKKEVTFSQTAVESVLRDIRTGNTEHVDRFFASRPDWQEKDDKAPVQTDTKGEKGGKTAQA